MVQVWVFFFCFCFSFFISFRCNKIKIVNRQFLISSVFVFVNLFAWNFFQLLTRVKSFTKIRNASKFIEISIHFSSIVIGKPSKNGNFISFWWIFKFSEPKIIYAADSVSFVQWNKCPTIVECFLFVFFLFLLRELEFSNF